MSDMMKLMMGGSDAPAEAPTDKEDTLRLYNASVKFFRFVSALAFGIVAVAGGLLAYFNQPAETGTEEKCGKIPHCYERGICDKEGDCWYGVI